MTALRRVEDARVFLFLQGPSSSLFAKVGQKLAAEGHTCFRINLNAGDWVFWNGAHARGYRGRFEQWPAYLKSFLGDHGVTDIILLGEERPYHKVAVELAKEKAISVTVIEMGYLRPDWITVEKNGMSSNSHFPFDPAQIRQAAQALPQPDFRQIYSQSFLVEALLDLAYNLPNVFLAFMFPHYRRHGLFHPLKEYAGWMRRLFASPCAKTRAERTVRLLKAGSSAYFLYPLQLETDYQLRAHSPYSSQLEAIDEVLSSFAAHAPDHAHLLVKLHPLDNGLLDWEGYIAAIAARLNLVARVHYIDGGNLAEIMDGCSGIVSVNSTVVLHGLKSCVPAKVLGSAIYDVEGMTHQASLDSFWGAPEKPDETLTKDFYRLLAGAIHVRGNFYSRRGTDAACLEIVRRLLARRINLPGGDCGYAPRKRPGKLRARPKVSNEAQLTTKGC